MGILFTNRKSPSFHSESIPGRSEAIPLHTSRQKKQKKKQVISINLCQPAQPMQAYMGQNFLLFLSFCMSKDLWKLSFIRLLDIMDVFDPQVCDGLIFTIGHSNALTPFHTIPTFNNPKQEDQSAPNLVKMSAPNLVKMYMTIRSPMSSIMEQIRPELSMLSALEL